jgi:hypothetical protein
MSRSKNEPAQDEPAQNEPGIVDQDDPLPVTPAAAGGNSAQDDPGNGVRPAQHEPAAVQPTPIQAAQDDTDQMEDQDEPPARTAQNEPTPPARQQRSQKFSRTSRRMSFTRANA